MVAPPYMFCFRRYFFMWDCCDVAKLPLTNNESKQKIQDHKLNRIPKEDQKLSLNGEILKGRSTLQVPIGLLL
jgi:hypothetical protein